MKIAKRDLKILLIILGVVIIVVAFLYGFQPLQESNAKVVQEITGLRAELSELQVLASKEEYYKTSTEEMISQAEEIFDKFPSDIKTEDCIMYAQELETNTKANVEGILFSNDTLAYSWGVGKVDDSGEVAQGQAAATENTATQSATAGQSSQETEQTTTADAANQANVVSEDNKELFVSKVTVNFKSTYQQLKEIINDIQNSKNRNTLQSMEVSYDTQTGNLAGSVEMGMYSLTGLNKVYEGPNVPSITIGTDNIFGTVEVPAKTENQTEQTTQN